MAVYSYLMDLDHLVGSRHIPQVFTRDQRERMCVIHYRIIIEECAVGPLGILTLCTCLLFAWNKEEIKT